MCRLSALLSFVFLSVSAHAKSPSAYLLGPTGMMGSVNKKEIKVTKVDKGSPADGVIKPGDVITAANGKKFASNPRFEIAEAVLAAEAQQGQFKLTLKGGQEKELKLKSFGAFSETAPFNCEKTNTLVDAIAKQMIASEKYNDQLCLGWLGLMATGDPEHLKIVKEQMPKEEWANPDRKQIMAMVNGEVSYGYVGWYWGYQLICLGEYYLLTGDKSILPAMETYALGLSLGQDAAGIWGHRLISPERDGRLPGYSHINQPSLTCFIGLALANKCGINNPEVTKALKKCQNFYNTFTGKGTIPYGVHDPNSREFNNNGMSGTAAIAMSLVKDDEAAKFFSRQTAAANHSLESGHASYFFNVLWSPLGANLCGPELMADYTKRTRWLYTSYRSWDDQFTHNGSGHKAINTNGALLLQYCTPRKVLYITGKDANPANWVSNDEIQDILNLNQFDVKKYSADEMIAMFDHPAPQVRRNVGWHIREAEGDFWGKVDDLILNGNDTQQLTAIGVYGYKCPPEFALPRMELIGERIKDTKENDEVRTAAAATVACHPDKGKAFYNDILNLVVAEKDDPFGMLDKSLSSALNGLSSNPFADGLVTDKDLFYTAVKKLSQNPRQETRGNAMALLQNMPAEDFHLVADTVKYVTLNRDSSHHSYHNPQSTLLPGGRLLARLGIREGLDWAMDVMETKDGKHSFKTKAVVGVLDAYGAFAKPYVDEIQKDPELLKSLSQGKASREWNSLMKKIEKNTKPKPSMMGFDEAKKASSN